MEIPGENTLGDKIPVTDMLIGGKQVFVGMPLERD
jgi:hypothetical protein